MGEDSDEETLLVGLRMYNVGANATCYIPIPTPTPLDLRGRYSFELVIHEFVFVVVVDKWTWGKWLSE